MFRNAICFILAISLLGCHSVANKESNFSSIIEHVESAIVGVGVTRDLPNDRAEIEIIGTGFNVAPTGIVVTCEHVLSAHLKKYSDWEQKVPPKTNHPASFSYTQKTPLVVLIKIYIGTPKNIQHVGLFVKQAVVIYGSKDSDLAVLKLDGKTDLPFVTLGNSDKAKPGQKILIGGYPFGEKLFEEEWGGVRVTFAEGLLSSILPYMHVSKEDISYFQLDVTANPGNSGGPVFLADTGQVIGVLKGGEISNVLIPRKDDQGKSFLSLGQIPRGINFAIPINKVKGMIEEIKTATAEDIKSGEVFKNKTNR